LRPNILLSTQFSNTLNLCSSFSMIHHVSYPYKTGKIMVLHTLIFKFSQGDKRFWKDGSKHFLNSICS
jgi:hypothetical protein